MFEFFRTYQLSIMMVLSGICGTLAILVLLTRTLSLKRKMIIMCLEFGAMFLLIFDRYSYIYRGNVSTLGYYMVRISNFLVFFFTLVVCYAYNQYLKDLTINEIGLKNVPKRLNFSDCLLFMGLILLVISRIFGFYYAFDETNHYYRTDLFYICYGIPLLAMLFDLSIVIQHHKKLKNIILIPLMLFSIVPFVAAFIQIFAYGISLVNIAVVGVAVILYVFVVLDMNHAVDNAKNNEIELLKESQKNSQLIFEQTAQALSVAIDAKDPYTHGHSLRVAEYSRRIAKAVGVPDKECDEIYYTGLLHDVGKIGIEDNIIKKNGKLDDKEFSRIKAHPTIGNNILSSINRLPYLSIGAHYHHERYDGRGYPENLKGDDIPYIARIIAVADAYDAMTSKRSYRDPLPQQKVREELVKGSGTQFDPIYAKEMVHMIDLDEEYNMKEHEDAAALEGKNIILCEEYRSTVSEGRHLTETPTNIRIRCLANEDAPASATSAPSLVLFDSLDQRTHDHDDKIAKEMIYFEYGEIHMDGSFECHGARRMTSKPIAPDPIRFATEKGGKYHHITFYDIEAVKFDDHVRVRIYSQNGAYEILTALPDSVRYAYLGLTGEQCTITIESISLAPKKITENDIERIAEKISYIDSPEGDIPNVQVNGWCSHYSEGVKISEVVEVSFHSASLPTSRLVWHCPYLSVFTSDDGKVHGKNYREFCLMRLDGESWETDDYVKTNLLVNKADGFVDWDTWKSKNKEGFDCKIKILRKDNVITIYTADNAIELKNTVTILDENVHELYLALTGDQVAMTNIKINTT